MTPLNDPKVREALNATRLTYKDGTKTSGYFLNDENLIPLVTAICAWQRAQDVKEIRAEGGKMKDHHGYPSVNGYAWLAAADHLEALK